MGGRGWMNNSKYNGFPVHDRQWLWCTNITESVKRAKMQERTKGQKRVVVFCTSLKFRWVTPYLDTAQQPQEQQHPFLPVCVVFLCVHTIVWLPVFAIFNVRTDVDACHCTQGLYGHCTGRKKSLAAPGSRTRVSITPGFTVGCENNSSSFLSSRRTRKKRKKSWFVSPSWLQFFFSFFCCCCLEVVFLVLVGVLFSWQQSIFSV